MRLHSLIQTRKCPHSLGILHVVLEALECLSLTPLQATPREHGSFSMEHLPPGSGAHEPFFPPRSSTLSHFHAMGVPVAVGLSPLTLKMVEGVSVYPTSCRVGTVVASGSAPLAPAGKHASVARSEAVRRENRGQHADRGVGVGTSPGAGGGRFVGGRGAGAGGGPTCTTFRGQRWRGHRSRKNTGKPKVAPLECGGPPRLPAGVPAPAPHSVRNTLGFHTPKHREPPPCPPAW